MLLWPSPEITAKVRHESGTNVRLDSLEVNVGGVRVQESPGGKQREGERYVIRIGTTEVRGD